MINESLSPTKIDQMREAMDASTRRMSRRTAHLGLDIAKRVKRARDAAGLTIADLAARAHTTPRTIHSLSEGRGGASSVGLLADIAKALKVSPAWLCFGEGAGPKEEDDD